MTGRILRWVIGLLIIALIGIRLSIFTVRQGEVAVVARFGEVRRIILEPGWYSKWFWPIDRAHHFDNRRRVFSPTYVETLTRDQRNIIVWSYVVWSIGEPKAFVESFKATKVGADTAVEDAELALNSIILDAQNAVIGSYDLTALVSVDAEKRKIDMIETDVVRAVKAKCKELGIRLHQFGLKRLALPESTVKQALEGMGVKRLIEANRYRGEGGKAARRIRVEADLEAIRVLADASRRAEEIRGRAEADAARELMKAHREDPAFYAWLRSLEALRKIITHQTMLILDTASPPLSVLKQPTGPAPAPTTTTQPVRATAGGVEP